MKGARASARHGVHVHVGARAELELDVGGGSPDGAACGLVLRGYAPRIGTRSCASAPWLLLTVLDAAP